MPLASYNLHFIMVGNLPLKKALLCLTGSHLKSTAIIHLFLALSSCSCYIFSTIARNFPSDFLLVHVETIYCLFIWRFLVILRRSFPVVSFGTGIMQQINPFISRSLFRHQWLVHLIIINYDQRVSQDNTVQECRLSGLLLSFLKQTCFRKHIVSPFETLISLC